ncbi:MAG: peroxiredoxin [Atribacterota bacterium]|nr:peroxiredoxin [Atribacterota bacterium]
MSLDFPDFERDAYFPEQRATGRLRKGDLRGKWVILYFYPRDGTPGCTQEALEFSQFLEEIRRLGGEVVGVSTQSPESHRKFAEKHGLKHILMSDDGALAEALGILRENGTAARSTFLLSPEGKIERFWKNVRVRGHVEEVIETLKTLRAR